MKGLEIDFETADRITLCTLKEQRKYLKKELKDHEAGCYLHPEDVVNNMQMIKHLTKVIDYFGG